MTNTNRSNTLRSAAGLFAMGFALLSPLQSHAQEIKSLINFYTGAALSNGNSISSGTPLSTSVWMPLSVGAPQKWAFFSEPADPDRPGTPMWKISSTVFSRMSSSPHDLDVVIHLWPSLPMISVVQANRLSVDGDGVHSTDGNSPWKFQRWKQLPFGSILFPNTMIRYSIFQDWATGMCLTDLGNPATGGTVVQTTCDYNPRQLWAVYNHNTNRWD